MSVEQYGGGWGRSTRYRVHTGWLVGQTAHPFCGLVGAMPGTVSVGGINVTHTSSLKVVVASTGEVTTAMHGARGVR